MSGLVEVVLFAFPESQKKLPLMICESLKGLDQLNVHPGSVQFGPYF